MFPDQLKNDKYLEECDEQISKKLPRLAKWFKRSRNILFMAVLVLLFFTMARDLIKQPPNLLNLIYLVLFTVTFGKMCITSLDGDSTKACLRLAKMIKYYSAVVLVLTVTYHLIRFQFYDLDDFFDQLRAEKNFFVVNLKFLGFAETESDTRHSV